MSTIRAMWSTAIPVRTQPYDYEGTNNGVAVDREGHYGCLHVRPAAISGIIAARNKVSFYNFGFFTDDQELPREKARRRGRRGPIERCRHKKALVEGIACEEYRQFDEDFADSEAWVKYMASTPAPKQISGVQQPQRRRPVSRRLAAVSLVSFVRKGRNLPKLPEMVRLGNGTTRQERQPGNYCAPRDGGG